jgi:hypothetical protein
MGREGASAGPREAIMVNQTEPQSSDACPPGVDPMASTGPWPAYPTPPDAPPTDNDLEMTPIGPGLNDGELLPDDTPPIENDLPGHPHGH